jgi:hypothetical protein
MINHEFHLLQVIQCGVYKRGKSSFRMTAPVNMHGVFAGHGDRRSQTADKSLKKFAPEIIKEADKELTFA